MYSFGSGKVRSLESFGISGVLGANAQIYYQPLFSTRHLGKVSDLICIKLKQEGLDELRLRAALLLGLFQGYRSQFQIKKTLNPFKRKDDGSLEDPILIEIGIDSEKVAIGICFNLSANLQVNLEGLVDRVESEVPKGPFEEILIELKKYADRIILKVQPETQRFELISVLGIHGKIDRASIENKQPLTLIRLKSQEIKQTPRPKLYQALGDLNYAQLLKPDEREKSFQPDPGFEENTAVAAQPEKVEEVIHVAGTPQAEVASVQVVSSQQSRPPKAAKVRPGKVEAGGVKGFIRGLFGKIWNRSDSEEGEDEDPEYEEEWVVEQEPTGATNEELVVLKANSDTQAEELGLAEEEAGQPPGEDRLDQLLLGAKEHLISFQKEFKNEKVRVWIDGLLSDVMRERADLKQIYRKMNLGFRQKEYELKRKNQLLQEELRAKDEEIQKRQSALNRAQDQIDQMTKNIERYKNASQDLSLEMQFKQKYHAAQKMHQLAKEENAQLSRRVEELRIQLNAAQVARIQNIPAAELSALQTKYDRLYRQAEDFKKANRQLMEQLNEVKRGTGNAPVYVDELKARLDAAMKLATSSKKESETMRAKLSQMIQRESNLKAEVMKLRALIKPAQPKAKKEGEE